MGNKWKGYVKEDLGIDVDFYCVKHLNLDEPAISGCGSSRKDGWPYFYRYYFEPLLG